MKDLIVLTACKNSQFAIQGLMSRLQSLNIGEISFDILVHPEKDPGCAKAGADFLRSQAKRYHHALLVFDYEGSGVNDSDPASLRESIQRSLNASGWRERSDVIVLVPELEIWVWSDSPEVDNVLGWGGRIPSLRAWMKEKGFLNQASPFKPQRPKEAVEAALFHVNRKRSSSMYLDLATKVSFKRCADPSFNSLVHALQRWFAKAPSEK